MELRPPSEDELRSIGDQLHLGLTERELDVFTDAIEERLEVYNTVENRVPTVSLGGSELRERSGGQPPQSSDDPHNAWVTQCEIRGEESGSLEGMEIGIKDNICVGGVPMTCGSSVIEGYVPNVDATIVTRLLEAGATIVGKTNMDDMAMTISGHSAFGPIRHPENDAFLAGGSSGGSAVVVRTGEVDAAIGTDQGGSIRIPAAYCGIVGLKPTFGLVPYSGSVGLEHMIDHPGPMARDVETTATVLEAIAGPSPHDARRTEPSPNDGLDDLEGDAEELTIGRLEEGFDLPNGDNKVLETIDSAVDCLEDAGASVENVSIPMHAEAGAIHAVVGAEGLLAAVRGEGQGHGVRELYNLSWIDTFGKFRRAHGHAFPASFKLGLLLGAYVSDQYHSRHYAKGMNLVLDLRNRYAEALESVDLLAMPTVAATAPRHDDESDDLDRIGEGGPTTNTPGFNRTGHPAISVPAGRAGGLPVGLMLVGALGADATVLDGALACERVFSD